MSAVVNEDHEEMDRWSHLQRVWRTLPETCPVKDK